MMFLYPWCEAMNNNANSVGLASAEKIEASSGSGILERCRIFMAEQST